MAPTEASFVFGHSFEVYSRWQDGYAEQTYNDQIF